MARFMRLNLTSTGCGARPLLELAAVTALVAVDLWLLDGRPELQLLARSAAVAVVIASFLRRRTTDPAPVAAPLGRAWREATVATLGLATAVLVFVAVASGPFDEPSPGVFRLSAPALGLWLLRRLALALFQQFVLHRFMWPVAREMLPHGAAATLAVAVAFGLLHLPSPALAAATGVAAAVWITVYRRGRRLLPVIVSHALLVALASTVPGRLFYQLDVGSVARSRASEYRFLDHEDTSALLRAVSSRRYFDHRGGSDHGYVEGLYRDVLGRPADAEEVDGWVGRLRRTSRLAVAERMLLADELDAATLWHRFIDDEPLAPGVVITADSARLEGWYEPEPGWRWAREVAPTVRLRLDREPQRDYVLTLSCGAAAPLGVELELNGRSVGSARFAGFAPVDRRFVVAGRLLDPGGDNELRLRVSGELVTLPGDSRALGLGLRQLELVPLRFPAAAISFLDDDYFLEGFSIAEERLRWSREPLARLTYPLHRVEPGASYMLELTSGAFGRQVVAVRINGRPLVDWTFENIRPQTRKVRFDGGLLRTGGNEVELRLPGARGAENDARRLGLALVAVRLYPLREVR